MNQQQSLGGNIKFSVQMTLILFLTSCAVYKISSQTPFPKPTGVYKVGTKAFHNIRAVESNDARERILNVRLWFPKQEKKCKNLSDYITDSRLIDAFKQNEYLNLKSTTIDSWGSFKSHSYDCPVANYSLEKFPLIILSHGFGMSKNNYSALAVEIASHGYIVAAIDHFGSGLTILPNGDTQGIIPNPNGPDGKVIEFCEDASFVINELLKEVNLSSKTNNTVKIGMIGHSLGGAAALNMGSHDNRIGAAVNLDGYLFGEAMEGGVNSNFLSILQKPAMKNNRIPDSLKNQRKDEWKNIVKKSKAQSFVVNIKGTIHYDFSDLPFIIPDSLRIKNGGTLKKNKVHKIVSELVTTFLDNHLKGKEAIKISQVIEKYEEISNELD